MAESGEGHQKKYQGCTTNPEITPRKAELPIPTKLRIGGWGGPWVVNTENSAFLGGISDSWYKPDFPISVRYPSPLSVCPSIDLVCCGNFWKDIYTLLIPTS